MSVTNKSTTLEVDYYRDCSVLPNVTSCPDLYMMVSDLSSSVNIRKIAHRGQQRANVILLCFASCDNALLL